MSDTPIVDKIVFDHEHLPSAANMRIWPVARELERENAELKATLADIEEREAACCPEDVPFDELILALRELIARLERENAELKYKADNAQKVAETTFEELTAQIGENAELRRLIHLLSKRLKAIINVTDRATVEFDDARAALRLLDAAKGAKE